MLISLVALLAGCSPTDTGLSNGGNDGPIVNGTGGMLLDPVDIHITDMEVGYSKSLPFTITSTGDGDLVIYDAKIVADLGDVFYFVEITDDVTLAVGQSVTYNVTGTLPDTNPAEGQLRLRTNDPENTTVTMHLTAWPVGYQPPADTGDTGGDSGTTP